MLLGTAVFAVKERPQVAFRQMRQTPIEELIKIISDSGKNLRSTDGGRGVNVVFMYNTIKKANKLIAKKNAQNLPLQEAEKWIFENFYLIYRFIFRQRSNMMLLPHVENVPRIVILARIIVDNSLNSLNDDRIKNVLEQLKIVLPLNFKELKEFNNAVGYAIIEQLFILSQRLLYQETCKIKATKCGYNEKLMKSDVYTYHLLCSEKLNENEKTKLEKKGIVSKNILLSYNNTLVRNTDMASTLLTALRNINNLIPIHIGLKFLGAYQELLEFNNFKFVDIATQISYFEIIEKLSISQKTSETFIAKKLVEFAKFNNTDISNVLYDDLKQLRCYVKNNKLKKIKTYTKKALERVYICSICALSIASSVILALYVNIALGIIAFIPLIFIWENMLNYLLEHTKAGIDTPKMDYKSVPYEHNVMVIISEFIASFEQFLSSLRHAEVILESNCDKNIQVAMLLDLKGGNTPIDQLNFDIENYLEAKTLDIRFNIFIRKKEKIGEKYQGRERKRGAIMALNKMLITQNKTDFAYIYNENYVLPHYIVTLDADNTMLPGEIKDMVNMMAHPYNSKYDLLATQNKYNLFSLKTKYAIRFLGESGLSGYPFYTSLYKKLFNKEIFCGKGIYRLLNFFNKLEEVLPSNKVLSHDIIEGSILNTGCGSVIFEDAPSGFIADRERRKRWQRGDIQLLPFIKGRWKTDSKANCKKDISPIYKFLMTKNIITNLKEILLLSAIISGLFTNYIVLLYGIGLFLMPYLINQIKILRGFSQNIRLRYILKNSIMNVGIMIEDFFMLSYYAFSNICVLFTTLLRMLNGKKLLEWKTYYNSQNSTKLSSYIKEFSLPLLWSTLIFGLLCFLNPIGIWLLFYLLIAMLIYIELFVMSNASVEKEALSKENKEILARYAEKTFKYFIFMSNDKGLTADNLQIKPYKGASKTTSPTNIGFSMLAQICGYYLGFNNIEETFYEINKVLDCVDKLPKWQGNLYNWYAIDTQKQVNEFVSSIDSGNFLTCLLIVKEFFSENNEIIGEMSALRIIKETHLDKLYDNAKNLFYNGFDGEKFVGHYDLLASEARILSTVFVALYNKKSHFNALQRDYTSYKGNTLLSWSGTAFEYLMPDIFFGSPHCSSLYKSSVNAVKAQISEKRQGLWGISESGCYRFDENMLYQYFAFGINKLALRSEKRFNVLSPYASILCLPYNPNAVIKNLQRLAKIDLLNEYGFYESVECSKNIQIISSYMTHHQGMILCNFTNVLCDNILQKLLLKNSKIEGALNLYNELMPNKKLGKKMQENLTKCQNSGIEYSKNVDNIEQYFHCGTLFDLQYCVNINALGKNFSKYSDIYISEFSPLYEEATGGYFFVSEDGKDWYSPTYLPLKGNKSDYTFSYNNYELFHTNVPKDTLQAIAIVGSANMEVRKLTASNKAKKVAFYMDIALNTYDGYYSHPAFNDLFVKAELSEDKNVLFLTKSNLSKNIPDFCIGVKICGLQNIVWECNKGNFVGRNNSLQHPKMLFDSDKTKIYPSLGDVISPCVGFTGEFDFAFDKNECQVCISYGKSKKEVYDYLMYLPDNMYNYATLSVQKYAFNYFTQQLLGELIYLPYPQKQLNTIIDSGNIIRFNTFSQGKKIISYTFSEDNIDSFETLIKVLIDLNMLKITYKVVIEAKKDLSENVRSYVISSLDTNLIYSYSILNTGSEELNWAFIKLSSKLNFVPNKLILSKAYQIESELSNFTDGEIIPPPATLLTGFGGFNYDNKYFQQSEKPTYLPYSTVVTDKLGGFLATNNGGGFFYFDNSRENKMTRFDNNYVFDRSSEFLYIKTIAGYHKINGGSGKNRINLYNKAQITHLTKQSKILSSVTQYMLSEGKIKIMEISISNLSENIIELVYGLYPSLNWVYNPQIITFSQKNDIITVKNYLNNTSLYLKIICDSPDNITLIDDREVLPYFEYYSEKQQENIYICATQDVNLCLSINKNNIQFYREKTLSDLAFLDKISIRSEKKSFDLLVNFLPQQIYFSRLIGKFGFYQVGGATGFRDQLQDSLAFLHNFEITKEQIIYSAMHQYESGDVMHWWHHPKFGLRTRITDDRLFLPYAVCEYIKWSGDMDILNYEIPYLVSNELAHHEESRLENPEYTTIKDTLFRHCLRTIRISLKYGEHKLLIMGKGDWNDGMDDICGLGRGESVFNSMFCYEVLTKFARISPTDLKEEMLSIANDLAASVNAYAYEGDRYKRLFSDDGRWFGSVESKALELDLLVQSYAVISGVAEGKRANTVLDTAKKLVDEKAGIIKLLTPPLTKSTYFGYISAYPKGVRENGGQYTHASMWYLIALTKINRQDEAFELFQMINPVEKCRTEEGNNKYMGEPYVFSGDVYSNKDNYGRMGWSWYTGSAAWAFKLVIEHFYGLTLQDKKLRIEPKLPKKLNFTTITYRNEEAVYTIEYRIGDSKNITLNGEIITDLLPLEKSGVYKIVVQTN